MKQIYLLILLFLTGMLQSQNRAYQYDATGNRTGRTVPASQPAATHTTPLEGWGGDCGNEVEPQEVLLHGPVLGEPLDDEPTAAQRSAAAPASAFTGVPTTVAIDRTKGVGEIPITQAMQNGALTYTVPIDVYPGRDGFQPQIALSYNSLSANGVAGYGWHISGLSVITPIHGNYYFDQLNAKPEAMGWNATYAIDGTRLNRISSGRFEAAFGRIKVNTSGITNRYFFKAEFAEGRRSTYGFETTATPQVSYPVSRTEDLKGNFINYQYTLVGNVYHVSQITYGTGTQTIGKIVFTYTSRTDYHTSYMAGQAVTPQRLLTQVQVYHQNTLLRTYTLQHTLREQNYLTRIGCKAGSAELNPLQFYYGTDNYSGALSESNTFLNSYFPTNNKLKWVKQKADPSKMEENLAVYPDFPNYTSLGCNSKGCLYGSNYSTTQKILIYKNLSGNGVFLNPVTIYTGAHFHGILSGDIKGNGAESLIKINYGYESGSYATLRINCYDSELNKGTEFVRSQPGLFSHGGHKSVLPRTFLMGNFTGSGKSTLLSVSGNKTPVNTTPFNQSFTNLYDLDLRTDVYTGNPFTYDYFSDILFTLDFDGDGRTDICLVNSTGMHIYTYQGGTFVKLHTETRFKNTTFRAGKMALGDLNGDGKTDIIVAPPSVSGNWEQRHNGPCYQCCRNHENLVDWDLHDDYYECRDGEPWEKCHITHVWTPDPLSYRWGIMYSTGRGFTWEQHTFPFYDERDIELQLHDLNGDNLPDLIVRDASSLSVYLNKNGKIQTRREVGRSADKNVYIIPSNGPTSYMDSRIHNRFLLIKNATVTQLGFTRNESMQRKMTGMVNSLGVVNKHTYLPMSNSDIYRTDQRFYYPYNNIVMNECLLKRSELYVNGTRVAANSYQYKNSVLHKHGLGLQGYRIIQEKDEINNRTIERTYNPNMFGVLIKEESAQARTQFNYELRKNSYNVHQLLITSQSNTDLLTGFHTSSTYTYNTAGYPTREVTRKGNAETITTVNTYNDWYFEPGKLYDRTVTAERGGNTYTERQYITEHQAGTQLPLKIVSYRNGQVVSQQTNTYTNGNLIKEEQKFYTSPNLFTRQYEYDAFGRITKETDPYGLATTYTRNAKGELTSTRNHRNHEITFGYDDWGRLKSTTYPDGITENISYSWVTAPTGALWLATTTTTGKPTTQVYYDPLNREIRSGEMTFNGSYRYTDTRYDSRGRLSQQSMPFRGTAPARWTTYTYDIHDRPLSVTAPNGKSTTWTYNRGDISITGNGITTKRTYDAAGHVTAVTDPGGTITYQIRADGQPSQVLAPGGIQTTFGYDTYGRRTRMTDPSFGDTHYEYDAAGNLTKETSADGHITRYTYDALNRLVTRTLPEMTVTHTYNTDNQLQKVSATNSTMTEYTYDTLLRLVKTRETMPGNRWLEKELTYSSGNLQAVKYTSDKGVITTENMYYTNGHLTEQKLAGQTSFFKLTAEHDLGMPTTVVTGGVTRSYTYDAHGKLTARAAKTASATIQHFGYNFDTAKGNLISRTDQTRSRTENFGYDSLNRLTSFGGQTATFDAKGNILQKSDAGTLGYTHTAKPYAITQLSEATTANVPTAPQAVTYTSFKRPATITENGYTATFTYNAGADRVRMQLNKNNATELTRTYIGGCYETDETAGGNTKEKLYLGGDYYTAPAVYVRVNNGSWQLYNICRDHLGSITHITGSSGSPVTEELSYNAWGRLRNPVTHAVYAPGSEPIPFLGRGYTGHEHLPWFGLVNMNARLYDPVPGRFLAPDPHVQAPDFTQNFNRYTYCLNNPLVYTDPDGEFWHIIIGALVGGAINLTIKALNGQITSVKDGFVAFGIGAAAGAVGAATGGAAFAAMGGAAGGVGGFVAGAAGGTVGAAFSMPVQSIGNTAYFGDPLMSFKDYAIGVGTGALLGGSINGSIAAFRGNNFWTGKNVEFGRGIFSLNNTPTRPAPEMRLLEGGRPQVGGTSSTNIGKEGISVPTNRELYHYTTKEGYDAIMNSQKLLPSLDPRHARFGQGQYFTDLVPENFTGGQVSTRLYRVPWNQTKLQYHIKVNINGLNVIQNKPHNFLIPGTSPLDLNGRITGGGITIFKQKF